jgi:hypothetical protein
MKRNIILLITLLTGILLFSCNEQELIPPGKIQLVLNFNSIDASTGRVTSRMEDATNLIVSISKTNGEIIFERRKFDLLKIGDNYVSIPIDLPRGGYKLTDFMILNAKNEILFATPKSGSELAGLVKSPLPVYFGIIDNKISNVSVEVISTEYKRPELFGYVSFGIKLTNTEDLSISVIASNVTGTLSFLSSNVIILDENKDTIYNQILPAKVNRIFFNGKPDKNYQLVVIKQGYSKYLKEFKLSELIQELEEKPLLVTLLPALTFRTWIESYNHELEGFSFSFTSGGLTGKSLLVDWGDGTEKQIVSLGEEIIHVYDSNEPRFVSVTGDLTAITDLYFYYGFGPVSEISLIHLLNLKDFRMGFQRGPNEIDFSKNSKLETIDVLTSIERLDITYNPIVKNLSVGTGLSTESIDKLIETLYLNVQANSIYGGVLYFPKYNEETGKEEMVGPPSMSSISKLQYLETYFKWNIYPSSLD